jgi:hypothetical protein
MTRPDKRPKNGIKEHSKTLQTTNHIERVCPEMLFQDEVVLALLVFQIINQSHGMFVHDCEKIFENIEVECRRDHFTTLTPFFTGALRFKSISTSFHLLQAESSIPCEQSLFEPCM